MFFWACAFWVKLQLKSTLTTNVHQCNCQCSENLQKSERQPSFVVLYSCIISQVSTPQYIVQCSEATFNVEDVVLHFYVETVTCDNFSHSSTFSKHQRNSTVSTTCPMKSMHCRRVFFAIRTTLFVFVTSSSSISAWTGISLLAIIQYLYSISIIRIQKIYMTQMVKALTLCTYITTQNLAEDTIYYRRVI